MRIAVLLAVLAGTPDAGVKPIAVDNRALFDAFDQNEVAANKRYKNQGVPVLGGCVLEKAFRHPRD